MWQDLRFAFRTLRRQPLITLVVVMTLALGIGATTALFSVVNAVLLRDLPYTDSSQLYLMRTVTPDGQPVGPVTPREARPLYESDTHPTVETAAVAWDQEAQIIGGDGRAHITTRYGVTDRFFDVFRPRMALGRAFGRGERSGVVVIAYSTWRDLFGSDPNIIGKTVRLDPIPCRVIGVAPEGFEFPERAGYWYLMQLGTNFDRIRGYEAYVRLRPKRTRDQFQKDLVALAGQLGNDPATKQPVKLFAQPLLDYVVGDLGPTVAILFGATAVLLLIACINVTNLLLARVTTRSRELALREAVGAGRWRLTRQVLTESLFLSAIGGVVGLAVAAAGVRLLLWIAPADLPRLGGITLDRRVLLFTLGSTILVGLLVGLAPVLRLARNRIRSLVNEAGRGAAAGPQNRLFGALVIAEVGLAVILVIGAGLLVRSYAKLTATDIGFNPDHVLTFSMNVPGRVDYGPVNSAGQVDFRSASYRPMADFFRELTDRVRRIEGVQAVATTTSLPLKNVQYDSSSVFHIVGTGEATAENAMTAVGRSVSTDFFKAMEIRLIKGRSFEASDRRGSPGVAVVNETFARRFFPGEDAVGRRIRFAENPYTPTSVGFQIAERTIDEAEIVGVVADVKYTNMAEPAPPSVYINSEQWTFRRLTAVVRTSVSKPENLVPAIRSQIEALDPLVTGQFTVYAPIVRASTARERLGMALLTAFSLVALILAAVGIYGLMSYSVTQRTGEIAVRSALGASTSQVMRLILTRGIALALVGIVLGELGAVALRRVVASQLYQVSSLDAAVFVAVPLVLLAVALSATWIPADRARKIDPAEMLRTE